MRAAAEHKAEIGSLMEQLGSSRDTVASVQSQWQSLFQLYEQRYGST